MKKSICFYNLFYLLISLLILTLNYFIQQIVLKSVTLCKYVSLINHVNLVFVQNFGCAFGFLSNQNFFLKFFFIFFGLFICFFLMKILFYQNFNEKIINISYSLIIGGSLGNTLDRLMYGYVIDFIDFYIRNWHWPSFNVNDVGIFIGVLILILKDLKYLYKKK